MLLKKNKSLSLNRPNSIIFDTDNTLYEYEPANNSALIAVASKIKTLLGINREDFLQMYQTARKEIKMQLNEGNKPVIFNPLGGLKMTYLVMPVQMVK